VIEQTTVDHDFAKLGTRALIVLTLINMFNYIDRYVVPPLFESLRKEPAMGNPSDAQLGWLMTAFLIVYMMSSPLFGTLGDRMSRLRLIAFGVALWSCATTMGGFVGSFAMLFVARATVGVGEAAYGPISPAVLADYHAPATRGRVMSIFYCAIPIGSALGYVLGGLVDAHFGWRAAFFVAGIPGLLLAMLAFRQHIAAENAADLDAMIASFHRPRYHVIPMGAVSDGEAAVRDLIGGLVRGFPDFHVETLVIHHADRAVIVEARMTGTHRGEWAGLSPQGRHMDIQVACVFDFEGDRLVNETVYYDFATLQRQLGAV
jgi:steroid delta-isomerase-like uncharacterized protein